MDAAASGGTGGRRAAGPLLSSGWRVRGRTLPLDRPLVMGILNLTPDSFWEGSRVTGVEAALARAERLLDEGADLVDVGGESTRPGAREVDADEERARILPVIEGIARRWPETMVSVDTVKGAVARAALDAGAAVVNDVSGLRLDPEVGRAAARADAGLVLMHSRGTVERMASYETASYGNDPVGEIADELRAALARAAEAGVREDAVAVDPGLGFSKRTEHSVAVLAGLERIRALGRPVLVGPSRKRFLGDLAGGLPVEDRLEGTIAACVVALARGARIFRVHDVRPVRRALDVAWAISMER